jgi:outer membrane protein assembly factor BamB
VADGRVFVTDFRRETTTRGSERAVALDEKSGRMLWTRDWPVDYAGLDYGVGPRATPTVDGGRVYVLGAVGNLFCLEANTGRVLWEKDFRRDFGAELPAWGFSAAPLIDGERVIVIAAGRPNAKVAALDKQTGEQIWGSLSSEASEPGYSQPVLIEAGGVRQLIAWHAGAISSLKPSNGELLWEYGFPVRMNTPIATPVISNGLLLVSAFFNGSRLLRLASERPSAEIVWAGSSESEIDSDGLHALMGSPVIDGDYIYGVCSYGQLRCLRLSTGERVWESQAVTVERARNASAFIIRNGSRYFINNDRGELIIARFSPSGYSEISRADLLEPTTEAGANRREKGALNWSHPAYANGHVFARNDKEIRAVDLRARADGGDSGGR